MAVTWFGPNTLQSADFKPELGGEAVLVNVVHRIVAVPPTDDKHRVVADDGSVAEPIQWLSACGLDLLPLELFVLQGAPPEVVKALSAVVSCEDVDGAVVEDDCVVRACLGLVAGRLDTGPRFLVQVEVEKVVEVVAALSLVPTEEKQAVHVGDASGARSLLWLVPDRLDLGPPIPPYTVVIKVIQPLVIVRPREQINVAICKDALMTGPRRENLPR